MSRQRKSNHNKAHNCFLITLGITSLYFVLKRQGEKGGKALETQHRCRCVCGEGGVLMCKCFRSAELGIA